MNDDMVPFQSHQIITGKPTEIDISGGENTLISHANSIEKNVNVIIAGTSQNQSGSPMIKGWNHDYYNLFVMGGESFQEFSQGDFVVPKSSALTEYVAKDIAAQINALDDIAIATVKKFFCIFAARNYEYGFPENGQHAAFGFINNVMRQDDGFKIYYQTLNSVSQTRLNELRTELAIEGKSTISEFDSTHWSVKKVNLVEVLRDAGIMNCFPQ